MRAAYPDASRTSWQVLVLEGKVGYASVCAALSFLVRDKYRRTHALSRCDSGHNRNPIRGADFRISLHRILSSSQLGRKTWHSGAQVERACLTFLLKSCQLRCSIRCFEVCTIWVRMHFLINQKKRRLRCFALLWKFLFYNAFSSQQHLAILLSMFAMFS